MKEFEAINPREYTEQLVKLDSSIKGSIFDLVYNIINKTGTSRVEYDVYHSRYDRIYSTLEIDADNNLWLINDTHWETINNKITLNAFQTTQLLSLYMGLYDLYIVKGKLDALNIKF